MSSDMIPSVSTPSLSSSSAPAPGPPTKKRFFGKSNGSGRPDRNKEDLLDRPKPSTTQMSIVQTQQSVAVDLSGIPVCIHRISRALSSALQRDEEREAFTPCHVVAVCYNLWILIDRQASDRFGMGPSTVSMSMVQLHDLSASFVEALSSVSLSGVKLSTNTDAMVPQIKAIIRSAQERYPRIIGDANLDDDHLKLKSFPLVGILDRWVVLMSKASRHGGNLASWRLPDPKSDFSLLAHGVTLSGPARWMSCGTSALPPRLEKVCIALRLVIYEETGPSSFIPQVIVEEDRASLVVRCGLYCGLSLGRESALDELLTGAAPITKV